MSLLRRKLTYANVVATVALFLVLAGGSAFAASQLLPGNSVGAAQLKANAVTAAKIRNGAVTPAKLSAEAKATLSGPKGDTGARGPQGDRGEKGDPGASATGGGAQPTCPAGTELFGGFCFETSTRPAAPLTGAIFECVDASRFLPTPSELIAFDIHRVATSQVEWTESLAEGSTAGSQQTGIVASGSTSNLGGLAPALAASSHPFRCMVGPSF